MFDPADGRHHTKKASVRRVFERNRNITACIGSKSKLLQISRDIREHKYQDEQEKKGMQAELAHLDKLARKGEKAGSGAQRHPEIVDAVQKAISYLATEYPERIKIVEGMFQADSYIQHLLTTKQVDLAIGNDADFSVIAGDACLQLSDFTMTVKVKRYDNETTLKNATVATG